MNKSSSKGPKFGCRHVQILLICSALIFGFGSRTCLSVAIVAMTDNSTSSNPDVPTYTWTNTSVILSSFFWSYVILQVPVGYLGKRYGPKYFLLAGSFVNYCACAAVPFAAAKFGSIGVIFCRVTQGFSQSFLTPTTQVMLGTWVPEGERTTLSSLAYSGFDIGFLTASLLTGFIAGSWWGWTYSFYLQATMGFVWCALFAFCGQNSPASHPRITLEERAYIQSSLKQEENLHLPIPWARIFTCMPFYAILVASMGNMWCYAIMMTESPTYFAKVMDFSIESNVLINSGPTVVGILCNFGAGSFSDWLINKGLIGLILNNQAKKDFWHLGTYGMASCLTWMAYLTKAQAQTSILVLALTTVITSLNSAGAAVNHLDLSPRFCGVLFGILNACGQICSILAPLVAQWVITDQTNTGQWRTLFLSAGGLAVISATFYVTFASADRQEWDGPVSEALDKKTKKISVVSLTHSIII